jgi:hypothetical protein
MTSVYVQDRQDINIFHVEQLRKNAITATNELTDSLTTYVNEG